jgi:hypothetical protein
MARLKSEVRDQKKRDAKNLYVNSFSILNIAKIVGVTRKTLDDWKVEDNWEEEKELNTIKPSAIRKLTLKQALAISKGEKLPYKTNDIINTVAAFDRITDNKKRAVYFMESMDILGNFMLEKAAIAKPKKREEILADLKKLRPYADDLKAKLIADD